MEDAVAFRPDQVEVVNVVLVCGEVITRWMEVDSISPISLESPIIIL
jgi:hypothetical protein